MHFIIITIYKDGPINRMQFNRASKEYEYLVHLVEKRVMLHEKTTCKSCAHDPLAGHVDGNMKLLRWLSAKG